MYQCRDGVKHTRVRHQDTSYPKSVCALLAVIESFNGLGLSLVRTIIFLYQVKLILTNRFIK